jgi:drug/metabolite transporter (DMT)-like permease
MLIALAFLAAIGYGASDFAGGVASRRIRPTTILLYSHPVGAVLIALLLPLFPGDLSARAALLAAFAAVAGLIGFGLMFHLMANAPLSSVSPITAVLAAATPMGFGVLSGEHPRLLAWAGIGFGMIAVALISGTASRTPHARLRARVLLLASAAGAGFGIYFILLAHAGSGPSGLWPLMIARSTSAAVIVAVAARPAVTATVDRRSALTAACAGALDAAADMCFLLATRHGYLSLVSVVTALYPVITMLLALRLLGERAGWLPRAGMALSVVSLALVAA